MLSNILRRDTASMENFELLIRSLLIRPDQPAVIILGHFSPQIQDANGFLSPDHYHSVVAQFYDVPHVRCLAFLNLSNIFPRLTFYPLASSHCSTTDT